jgi:flavodoxin
LWKNRPVSRILVTYYSKTGNTRKVAEAIYQALPEVRVTKPMDAVNRTEDYDLIFVGFPIHSHSVPVEAVKFLRNLPRGKRIALFSTHGALSGSRLAREAIEEAVAVASQAKVISTFSCRGKVALEALEELGAAPEHRAWAEMAASAADHPNEEDLEEARAFARWTLTVSRSLAD